jgi:hypothetical protein
VANVLSTTSGMPASCAIAAKARKSATMPDGLPIVSTKRNFVLATIAARAASGRSAEMNVVSIPIRLTVTLS